MPEKDELIEPIPATMNEIVGAIFANHPKPRDPSKEKIKKEGNPPSQSFNFSTKTRKSQFSD